MSSAQRISSVSRLASSSALKCRPGDLCARSAPLPEIFGEALGVGAVAEVVWKSLMPFVKQERAMLEQDVPVEPLRTAEDLAPTPEQLVAGT